MTAHATARTAPRAWHAPAAGLAIDAFGLHIRSNLPLAGAAREALAPTHHRSHVVISPIEDGSRPARRDAMLLERRNPDGSLGMRVARLDDGAYLIDAPGHGRFTVAGDGSAVRYDRLAEQSWRWHRPLCAQALPLAATLQGFELFHASAVEIDGRAIAFVAASGSGKTSLAVALLARGAALVTDDVLALEPTHAGMLAHAGMPLANVAADQLALLPPRARARMGAPIGSSDKVHVEISNMTRRPLPVGAIFFLARSEAAERLTITLAPAPDPRDLLGATFMPHIVTRPRLISQLSTCAEIADGVPVLKLDVPMTVSAAHLAREVERTVSSLPRGEGRPQES